MSHINVCTTVIKSVDSFEAAVIKLGGTFDRDARSYRWFGRWVGDTPVPAQIVEKGPAYVEEWKKRLGSCDSGVATFPGAKYQVGLQSNGDGTYSMVYDYYSPGGLPKVLGDDGLGKLVQSYGVERFTSEARFQGHAIESEEVLEDGTIRVRLLEGY